MNLLAHIVLSGENEQVMMGNFAGDYIKGTLNAEKEDFWTKDFIRGVRLHRFIDHYTDTDMRLKELQLLLMPRYGRAASVGIDLLFDYFLASDFDKYNEMSLTEYVTRKHEIIIRNQELVPEPMKALVRSLIKNKWLARYNQLSTIGTTIDNMARYHSFLLPLVELIHEPVEQIEVYKTFFSEFYPRLEAAAKEFREGFSAVDSLDL